MKCMHMISRDRNPFEGWGMGSIYPKIHLFLVQPHFPKSLHNDIVYAFLRCEIVLVELTLAMTASMFLVELKAS